MLFNETIIKNRQNHLDSILNNEALLRKVLSIFSRGQEYEYLNLLVTTSSSSPTGCLSPGVDKRLISELGMMAY